MSAKEFPDEIFVTANSDGEFFGREDVDEIDPQLAPTPIAKYRLVQVGELVVEAKFVAPDPDGGKS